MVHPEERLCLQRDVGGSTLLTYYVHGPHLNANITTGWYWHERRRGAIRHALGFGRIRLPHYAPSLGRGSCRIDGPPALLCETPSASVSYN